MFFFSLFFFLLFFYCIPLPAAALKFVSGNSSLHLQRWEISASSVKMNIPGAQNNFKACKIICFNFKIHIISLIFSRILIYERD